MKADKRAEKRKRQRENKKKKLADKKLSLFGNVRLQ